MAKLLTVFGATGNQGGSVIRSVLAHPLPSSEYRLRGVTRNPTRPAAEALKAQGVDVVQADLTDSASVAAAIAGSHAVFGVTNCILPSPLFQETPG